MVTLVSPFIFHRKSINSKLKSVMEPSMNRTDEKQSGKRLATSRTTMDAASIKKRLRAYQADAPFLNLNDDCMVTIFEHLSQIDLCHVRNVCRRFAPLAETAFEYVLKRKPEWNKIVMAETDWYKLIMNESSTSDARRIVYKFGHLFRSIHVVGNTDSNILQRLTEITSLTLERVTIDRKMVRALSAVTHLKTLDLVDCTFLINKDNTSLSYKSLLLTRLTFQKVLPPLYVFTKLLQCTQRLRCLGLPIDLPDGYIKDIGKHAKKLPELIIFVNDNSVAATVPNMLGILKSVKKLTVSGHKTLGMCATTIIDGIKPNLPQLIHLEVKGFSFTRMTFNSMSEMKNIRHLTLMGMFTCEKTEFVSMVASLPHLSNLTFSLESCCSLKCERRDVEFNVMKDIVEAGTELNVLKLLCVRELRIDEKGYAKLLDAVKSASRKEKLAVEIAGCGKTTSFDVPMHVQKTNEPYLRIDYSVDKSGSCNSISVED